MLISRVSAILFLIVFLLIQFPSVLALGDYEIELYMPAEVIISDDETYLTFYLDGKVDYTGYSVSGDTIFLSSSSDIGETSISPEEVIFHSPGIEEFTLEIIIQNNYENGTTVKFMVTGTSQQGATTITNSVGGQIVLGNHSSNDNGNNLNNSDNYQQDNPPTGIAHIFMISITIIIITIIIIVIYKKK
jgi:hypothetical protein